MDDIGMKFMNKFINKSERITLFFFARIPLIRSVLKRQHRLKSFVCVSVLIVSVLTFSATYLSISILYQQMFLKSANEFSDAISQQVLSSMLQLMERGWTRGELDKFLKSLVGIYRQKQHNVEIFRGELVERLYGKVEQADIGKNVQKAFLTGEAVKVREGFITANIYPIKAEDKCLSCHANAKAGDVLGAIRIMQDISPAVSEAKANSLVFFLFLSPIAFIMAGLTANVLNARIRNASESFHNKIRSINNIRDLTKLDLDTVDLGFKEYNQTLSELKSFVEKIRSLAVDREIFEFELKLLEKFIITSEVVRDWKEHVSELMLNINKIIKAYTLFTVFMISEDKCVLDIFWIGNPQRETKRMVEEIIIGKIRRDERMCGYDVDIIHNICDLKNSLPEIREGDIELQTKAIMLEKPQIGGVVGVGLQAEIESDNIRSLVIEGVLASLLNVVGSVKAIHQYTKDLEYYATRDPMTNLYNQRMFWELLGYEVGRAKRSRYKFSVLVIDLDNFKLVNDSYSHIFGDKFLTQIASGIRGVLREGDILARYGGDEFVVILPDHEKEQAYAVACRIKEYVDKFSLIADDGRKVKTTVSIGLSVFPDHGMNAKNLFSFADNMMYKAKAEGRNIVIMPTEEDIMEVGQKTNEMAGIVMRAIEDKRLVPYFQPIINVKTGDVQAYEVLCRINTDEGIREASEFIDIAERLGVVSKLDFILMHKIFERIQKEDFEGSVFINLSPKFLILKEFIPNILKLSKDYNIDHSRITFEITERETVRNLTLLEKFVRDLKLEGFKFAIDDFGSGFSSFHYIKKFPIDFVKIEGEFIRNMINDEKDAAFVRTISHLANELNIKTVAEYVESCEVLDAVKDVPIDYAQGYYIGKPLPDLRVNPILS